MLYYIKKYPLSLTIILIVIYLSFFKPPSVEINDIPYIDKVAHVCMYFGMSGMLLSSQNESSCMCRVDRKH